MKKILFVCFLLFPVLASAQWRMPARQVSVATNEYNLLTPALPAAQSTFVEVDSRLSNVVFSISNLGDQLTTVNTSLQAAIDRKLDGTNLVGAIYSGDGGSNFWTITPASVGALPGTNVVGALFLNNQWRLPEYNPITARKLSFLVGSSPAVPATIQGYQGVGAESGFTLFPHFNTTSGVFTTPFQGVYSFSARLSGELAATSLTSDVAYVYQYIDAPGPSGFQETNVVMSLFQPFGITTTNTHVSSWSSYDYLPANATVSFQLDRRTFTNRTHDFFLTIQYHGPGELP